MTNNYANGGLKMLDIAFSNKALNGLKKISRSGKQGQVEMFPRFAAQRIEGNIVAKGNLNLKDTKDLKISDPFVKDIFKI